MKRKEAEKLYHGENTKKSENGESMYEERKRICLYIEENERKLKLCINYNRRRGVLHSTCCSGERRREKVRRKREGCDTVLFYHGVKKI